MAIGSVAVSLTLAFSLEVIRQWEPEQRGWREEAMARKTLAVIHADGSNALLVGDDVDKVVVYLAEPEDSWKIGGWEESVEYRHTQVGVTTGIFRRVGHGEFRPEDRLLPDGWELQGEWNGGKGRVVLHSPAGRRFEKR